MNKEELFSIKGGSSTMLNAVARFITTVYELGKSIGSTIRRVSNKNYC